MNVRPGRSHAHGHIAWIRLRIGEQLKANLLRQFGKCLPHPGPLAALRIPVVLPLIGAKPDFGRANRVFSHVVIGRLQQEGHIGWRGHRCRQIRKDCRALHFKGLLLRIGQNHQSAGGQCGKRLNQLPATSIEFGIRILSSGILLLHARGAIQNHNRCIGASTASQRQPTTRKRPTGRQEDGGHGQHPQHHDEPVTQPRIPARNRFGRHEKHHCRPLHRLKPSLVDQMDNDRQTDQRQCGENEGLKECHRNPFPAARPTRKRASTCS